MEWVSAKAENMISVCLGTACHVKGSGKILEELKRKLKIQEGENTEDMKFCLEVVRCIGACSLAPAVVVNDRTYRHVAVDQLDEILSQY